MSSFTPTPCSRGKWRRRPALLTAAALFAASAGALVLASPAFASTGVCGVPLVSGSTATITCTAGGIGTITVPAGVTGIMATLSGAGGGSDGAADGGNGGAGAQVVADLAVTPGAILDVTVGSQGTAGNDAGFGSESTGGSGGGLVAVTTSTGTPLLTAGSGGGAGGPDTFDGIAGALGGNSDGAGAPGCAPQPGNATGGNGGSPGTATAGGVGGAGGVAASNTGADGSSGGYPNAAGGAGGITGNDNGYAASDGGSGGAGYGGGGGGGGGGGSSYVSDTVTGTTPTVTDGVNAADGSVVFTYAIPTAVVPTVAGVSPNAGPSAGGNTVTITGTGLTGAAVAFGATPATAVSCTATSCTATAPAGVAGIVDVTATTAAGTSATGGADQYTYDAAPTVTSLTWPAGLAGGGTLVQIFGTGLAGATAITFGSSPAESILGCSATNCNVYAPAGTVGAIVDVRVTTPGGTSATSSADKYTFEPAITAAGPSGPLPIGSPYTYTFTTPDPGHGPGGAASIIVNLTGAAASFTAVSANILNGAGSCTLTTATKTTCNIAYATTANLVITLTVAPAAPGTVTATGTVSNAGNGTATASTLIAAPAPTVTHLNPTYGDQTGGTSVTITGTGFTGATAVHFGTLAATAFTVNSATQITATAPADTTLGPVNVTVTTPGGTSATVAADKYTYVQEVGKVTAAGRIDVGSHDAEFSLTARTTTPGGQIKGNLEYNDQTNNVKINQATITTFYLTSPTTAYAAGTARCKIGGTTSTCSFSVTVADNGDSGRGDGGGSPHHDTFTLTYNTATVGGTVEDGCVQVTAGTGGHGHGDAIKTTALRQATASPATSGPLTATPVTAAMTGGFTASLLGISLSGGHCATATLIYTDGTADGNTSCLLLGVLGVNIEVNMITTTGTTGTGTATETGTATVTVAGLLPVTLPITEVLTTTGLQLTVGGVTLPALPIGTGGIQIG